MKRHMLRIMTALLLLFMFLFPGCTNQAVAPEIMFCLHVQDYVEHPSDYVCLDIFVGNNSNSDIHIQKIDLFREDANALLLSINVDATLKPLRVPYSTSEFKTAFFSRTELPEEAKTAEDFMSKNQGLTYYKMVTIPVKDLLEEVEPDQIFRIMGIVICESENEIFEVSDHTGGYYATAPEFNE